MLNNQSSGLGPKCQLCDEEQLEQCLAQLQFSDRAKESIRQLFASGEVNPIIESYLQKNCVLLDDEFREGERDLRARISQQAKQVSTDDRAAEEIKPVEPEPPKAEINAEKLSRFCMMTSKFLVAMTLRIVERSLSSSFATNS